MQNPLTATRKGFGDQRVTRLTGVYSRIRFAPPLVIEETDLRNAIKIIEQSLKDLDEVSLVFTLLRVFSHCSFSSNSSLARTLLRRRSQSWTNDYEPASRLSTSPLHASALIRKYILYIIVSRPVCSE